MNGTIDELTRRASNGNGGLSKLTGRENLRVVMVAGNLWEGNSSWTAAMIIDIHKDMESTEI